MADIKEAREIRHASRLLHVMRYEHDCVPLFELDQQLFDPLRGQWIERRAGLVHEQKLRLVGEGARDAEPLLLAARQRGARLAQPILHFIP